MRTPGFRTRKVIAALMLVASLAACSASPASHAQEAQPTASATAANGDASGPGDDDPSGGPGGDPTSATAKPGTSKKPSTKPPASNPPAGATYADRLPKFDKAPPAQRVNLPEGSNAAWFSRIPTTQPVAFLTIDDGWVKRPEALELFREAGVPITLFLEINAIKSDTQYFKQLQDTGAVIEAHTITHAELKGKSSDFQRHEICGSADQLKEWYGRRPMLFRPPFGDKDDTTLQVVRQCGMVAAFFWKETVDKGIVRYQQGNSVQAGDIILMHFRDRFVDDFIAALNAIKAAGLTPALLEDYIPS